MDNIDQVAANFAYEICQIMVKEGEMACSGMVVWLLTTIDCVMYEFN